MNTFRLEYNEQQGGFHHEYIRICGYIHPPETNGWTTIAKECDNEHSMLFDWFLDATVYKGKSRIDNVLTAKQVKSAYADFIMFVDLLNKNNRQIVKLQP